MNDDERSLDETVRTFFQTRLTSTPPDNARIASALFKDETPPAGVAQAGANVSALDISQYATSRGWSFAPSTSSPGWSQVKVSRKELMCWASRRM